MLFTIFKKAKLTEVEIRAVRDCAKICGENVFKSTLSRKALGCNCKHHRIPLNLTFDDHDHLVSDGNDDDEGEES